jgi:hypothetical protein
MCPHTTIYVYLHLLKLVVHHIVFIRVCVLILLYMCPHTTIRVS